ncbi:beta-galactosidase family protein [Subtercola sp. RTI3]|uniref:glycoside hydrolase family 35 protein n=1 Tax=Subtercola sp. RTI3 TaxID=3048639 RepID=UPI002B22D1B3|nr:beta-galactosidase family protein [Subtercola sp. RTI3]MEA9986243.1 beta-galactosidase [Subtercola sp. RTI3]
MSTFEIGAEHFLLNGSPYRVMAGALHYFRVHPDQWADRIHKARLMGLNTIETYIPWNAHSPRRGEFRADGQLDVVAFLELVAAEGMHAIVRPGPYICAEWDNGGLPAWLFEGVGVGIRSSEPQYMAEVTRYLEQVLPLIAPLQIDRGGPVILVQIENEYGAYGSDTAYLTELVRLNRAGGITVPLTTIDQPTTQMLENGRVDGALMTASFGSRSRERLATLRAHQSTGPLMCGEYWNGWFDFWGGYHHTTSADETAADLRELLATGASFSLYMFHGGTNFGFTNGANDKGVYQPTVTSYDYDAPLAENGDATAKYYAMKQAISEFHAVPEESPGPPVEAPIFAVDLDWSVSLHDVAETAPTWHHFEHLPTADEVQSFDGFTLYRAALAPGDSRMLRVEEVRDRATVFVDRVAVGTLSRAAQERLLALPGGAAGWLQLLVEDQGRVNYGPRIGEAKGLIGSVSMNGQALLEWDVLTLASRDLDALVATLTGRGEPLGALDAVAGPAFVGGSFTLDAPTDLYLNLDGWSKGSVWVNGFNIGRYWSAGPQLALYVPRGALVGGRNDIVVFEIHAAASPRVGFVGGPQSGPSDV